MADYGTPMGVQAPGETTAKRPQAKPATQAQLKAALKDYDARAAGEARRSNASGRGTSQGDQGSQTKRGTIMDVIRDKKYRDLSTSEKE